MKQKHNRFSLNRYMAGIFVLLVVAIASAVVVVRHNRTEAAPPVKPPVGAAVPSMFSFTGATGWWQGATNKMSMALFYNSSDCFTSVQYKTGTVDVAAELQKGQASQATSSGTSTQSAVLTATLQTNSGPQQYKLHQYSLSYTGSGQKPMEGLELGYIQFPDGYVKVEGHCDTVDELPATIPALQAIKYSK